MTRIPRLASAILMVCAVTFSQADAQTNAPASGAAAQALPRDQHDGVTLSADAYAQASRSKAKFPKADPYPVGILPVEVFLSNDTDQPMQLDLSTVVLEVPQNDGRRQNVDWLTLREVAEAIAHPKGPSDPTAR